MGFWHSDCHCKDHQHHKHRRHCDWDHDRDWDSECHAHHWSDCDDRHHRQDRFDCGCGKRDRFDFDKKDHFDGDHWCDIDRKHHDHFEHEHRCDCGKKHHGDWDWDCDHDRRRKKCCDFDHGCCHRCRRCRRHCHCHRDDNSRCDGKKKSRCIHPIIVHGHGDTKRFIFS